MIRKTVVIISLVGLVVSVGLFVLWFFIWGPGALKEGAFLEESWGYLAASSMFATLLWLLRSYLPLRRRKLGLCLKCGYDLRGSSERCPECGTGFEEKVKQP